MENIHLRTFEDVANVEKLLITLLYRCHIGNTRFNDVAHHGDIFSVQQNDRVTFSYQ